MGLIDEIRNNRRSGAQKLSLKSLKAFIELVEKAKTDDAETQRELIFSIAQRIASAQPSMASVFKCMNNLFPLKGRNAEEIQRHAIRKAKREIEIIIDFDKRISENGARLLRKGDTILTLSSSSSVFGVLKSASEKNLKVIVCESYPKGEGAQFAKDSSFLAQTNLIPDFSFPAFLSEATYVLVGADAVSPLHVINKCGTRLIAQEARKRKVPFMCVCDTNKIIPFEPPIEEFCRRHKKIEKRETFFDRTPLNLVDIFITEVGTLKRRRIEKIARERKKKVFLSI